MYLSFENILGKYCVDEKLCKVIVEMFDCCADIIEALRSAFVIVEGSANIFGDV